MTEWISIYDCLPEGDIEIIVVNEKGDVGVGRNIPEKAKSILMYRQIPVTHWQYLPPPPKKKRWMPKEGEAFYVINTSGHLEGVEYWLGERADQESCRNFLGIYKDQESAQAMLEKIKAFVTSEIGEP